MPKCGMGTRIVFWHIDTRVSDKLGEFKNEKDAICFVQHGEERYLGIVVRRCHLVISCLLSGLFALVLTERYVPFRGYDSAVARSSHWLKMTRFFCFRVLRVRFHVH
jgi:hypothetical protein